jgi:ATP-dependent DNA helicase DinG
MPSLEEVLASARRNSLTRDNPKLATLPDWFEGLRDHQRVAIREILTAYEEGAECVVLDAPCGSGKTLIGECVRRLLSGHARQTSYICSSKALQQQFLKDYPYAKVLQGRSNYATQLYPERFHNKDPLSCADCTKSPGNSDSCMWCPDVSGCPYEQAKSAALSGDLAVLNTSYFLSECNGPGRFSRGGLVIADESDCLEQELMSHVEVRISERRLKQYGLTTPKYVTKPESWVEWAEKALDKVRQSRPPIPSGMDQVQAVRARKRHDILVGKLKDLSEGLRNENWVYTGDRSSVAFKPVTVCLLGQDKLWTHGDRWLLMSATVISADEMLESLGWDEDSEWRLVKCPSTFDKDKRKVIVWPVVSMTYKNRDAAWPEVTKACEAIALEEMTKNPGKILIHSSSYDLTRHIAKGLRGVFGNVRPIFWYESAGDKDRVFQLWQQSKTGIMVAPSLDRGIDLPGDACRTQIIVKVPFLSIKDKQVSARLYGTGRSGKIWYAVNAIRTIIQMTGRAVRSEDDYATTWILDRQFVDNLYSGYRNLVPNWWREALVWKKGSV